MLMASYLMFQGKSNLLLELLPPDASYLPDKVILSKPLEVQSLWHSLMIAQEIAAILPG